MTIEILFYVFSALVIIPALMTVLSRNVVNSALFMIVSFVGTAGLFILLESYFIALLQILVYAGAVMVLFLFIIMLIDAQPSIFRKKHIASLISSMGIAVLFACGFVALFSSYFSGLNLMTPALTPLEEIMDPTAIAYSPAAKSFGYVLFSKYLLPFEIAGVLLLIAVMGVIILSKNNPSLNDKN